MKFAIIGGTHGNESVGIKVIDNLKQKDFLHEYQTFLGNPNAYAIKKRYVDSDLNRAFGRNGQSQGYEAERSKELTKLIKGKFDFILDLHTTTSSMGLTVFLTRTDECSLKAACYLKKIIPDLKIIVSMRAGKDCPYTTALAPSALTVEVGPVANNVISASLVKATYEIAISLLNFDFIEEFSYENTECYHVYRTLSYPEKGDWMIHENVDGHDFSPLNSGAPLFTDVNGSTLKYEGDKVLYPLFVNEAAYQENGTAMELGVKKTLHQAIL